MPRNPRLFVPHGVYHVYCRVARGEMVFQDETEAEHWLKTAQETAKMHGIKVLAWCLLSNHYHLVLRSGVQPIWRAMARLQRRTARHYNLRHHVCGRLWQSRYKARIVLDERYFEQIVAYVHLNPVAAGVVADPARYRWSGHRELIGRSRPILVNVKHTLCQFGRTLETARKAYQQSIRNVAEERWYRQDVRHLPWWQSVRDDEQTIEASQAPHNATTFDEEWLEVHEINPPSLPVLLCWFENRMPQVRGRMRERTQTRRDTEARRLFVLLAISGLGHSNKDTADLLNRSPGSVSRWLTQGLELQANDAAFSAQTRQLLEAFVARESGNA